MKNTKNITIISDAIIRVVKISKFKIYEYNTIESFLIDIKDKYKREFDYIIFYKGHFGSMVRNEASFMSMLAKLIVDMGDNNEKQ